MAAFDVLEQAFADDRVDRERHRTRRLVGRACVLLLIVVLGAAAYAWRYQPLTAGSIFGARSDAAAGDMTIAYAPGRVIDLLVTVDNAGRLPVRVLGLPAALGPVAFSYEVRRLPPDATGYDDSTATPFRPVDLRAGEGRTFDLRYTLKDCGPPGGWGNLILRSQPVRYDVYGRLPRSADVALVRPLVITGMPAC